MVVCAFKKRCYIIVCSQSGFTCTAQIITRPLVHISHTMNKADIIEKVHEVVGGTRADAERAVEAVITSISDALGKGQEVSIAGLGIFATKTRNARTGRNPRTGESIDIPAMRVPKFRAAKALKDAVK
jgi:DNA-binding protein HU-beta